MKKFSIIFLIFLFVFNTSYIAFAQQDSTVEKLLEEGKQAYINGNFKLAVEKLSIAITIIKNKKDLLEAYVTLALTYFTLGDNTKSKSTIIKALQVKPNLALDTETYSPKFIVFVEDVKKEVMREVKFNIKPSAKLYIDEMYYGENTNFTIKLVKGKHSLKVEQKSYKTYEKTIDVSDSTPAQNIILEGLSVSMVKEKKQPKKNIKKIKENKPKTYGKIVKEKKKKKSSKLLYYVGAAVLGAVLVAALTKKKKNEEGEKYATIKINSVPQGANVIFDGQETGKTTPCVINNVSPGTHSIKILKELYGRYEKEVSVSAGQTLSVETEIPAFKYEYVLSWGSLGIGNKRFNNPISVALYNNDTRVFVVDNDNRKIKIFGTNGGFIGEIKNNLSSPMDVLPLANDRIFITDFDYNAVLRYNINGGFINYFGGPGTENGKLNQPYGLTSDDENNIYVADARNARIQVFNKDGDFVRKWGKEGTGDGEFYYPTGIAYNKANKYIYVSDCGRNRITAFSKTGDYVLKWGSTGNGKDNLNTPFNIAADRIGNIYVADVKNNRVVKFSEKGHYAVNITTGVGSGRGEAIEPYGVAVDKDGKVYIADTGNNRIQKFRITDKTASNGFAVIKVISRKHRIGYRKGIRLSDHKKIFIGKDLRNRIKKERKVKKQR